MKVMKSNMVNMTDIGWADIEKGKSSNWQVISRSQKYNMSYTIEKRKQSVSIIGIIDPIYSIAYQSLVSDNQ